MAEIKPMIPLRELKKMRGNEKSNLVDNDKTPSVEPVEEPKVYTYKILGVRGQLKDKEFSLDKDVIIGRDPATANVLYAPDYAKISRTHVKLEMLQGKNVYITDMGSTGGTYMGDGTKLEAGKTYILKLGACFYLTDEDEMFCLIK